MTKQVKLKTLGDYRDMCVAIGGEQCRAVQFLDAKIKTEPKGRDAEVIADESQMMFVLGPLLTE